MATDPVTSPKKWYGKAIFAVCCALITVLISLYGTAAEAVPYVILIMNILCAYIDMIGEKKNEEVAQ
jgi:Na+-translocating ferredoxin:NAD+ oxidoreductase RnfD subunit